MKKWKHGDKDMRYGNMETWTWGNGQGDMDKETWTRRLGHGDKTKRKTKDQAIFLYPFTVCSSCKRKFVVCSFVDEKQTEVIRLQTDLHIYGR